ncbi:MAG TPA: DUF222 domain-containing protein [Longimicrobiales bacterium]|nr:DUF222 domain-containing protein [Longimicrobiales bacterium]
MSQPATESALLELASGATTAQLERMVRAWSKGSRADEAAAERERYESRTLSVFSDDDGMYVIRGRLMPEVGALLMRAVEAAGDALFRDRDAGSAPDTQNEAAQRRADALGLLAERALAAGFGTPARPSPHVGIIGHASDGSVDGDSGDGGDSGDHGDASARTDDAPADVPISGTRAQRYQVFLHAELATLSADCEPGRAELEDGTGVSGERCRRLTCDASIVKVSHDRAGAVLDVARKTRTISPALRRALEVRDRGCRFPGCGLRFTDAHHVQHWADGGETSLSNCLLLCRYHHTLVHERGWRVEWWGKGRAAFVDPRGQAHFDGGWQPPPLGERPVDALLDEHCRLGVEPNAWTAGARWQRERDIPDGSTAARRRRCSANNVGGELRRRTVGFTAGKYFGRILRGLTAGSGRYHKHGRHCESSRSAASFFRSILRSPPQ